MEKKIEISLLQESEIDSLNEFYNGIHKTKRSKNDFLWEFYNAPAGKAIYVIAKDAEQNKIVGCQCAIPIHCLAHNGEVILTAKSEDTLVDPNYRGLNIFDKMYSLLFQECRKSGIKYIWGFTSAKKPFQKIGFEIPHSHSQSLLVFNIFSAYKYLSKLNVKNNLLSKIKIFGLCFGAGLKSLKRLFRPICSIEKEFTFTIQNDSSLESNEAFINNSFDKSFPGFMIQPDHSYLKWRFHDNPNLKKIFWINYLSNGELKASLIFNYHQEGTWYLALDLYSNTIDPKTKSLLLSHSIHQLRKTESDVKLIRTWDFEHNPQNKNEIIARKASGFVHLERGMPFVWKNLDESLKLKPENFILARMASEGVV